MSDGSCSLPDGVEMKICGIHSIDPCVYKDVEMHTNVTVIVSQCMKCGKIIISWQPTENTESFAL